MKMTWRVYFPDTQSPKRAFGLIPEASKLSEKSLMVPGARQQRSIRDKSLDAG